MPVSKKISVTSLITMPQETDKSRTFIIVIYTILVHVKVSPVKTIICATFNTPKSKNRPDLSVHQAGRTETKIINAHAKESAQFRVAP